MYFRRDELSKLEGMSLIIENHKDGLYIFPNINPNAHNLSKLLSRQILDNKIFSLVLIWATHYRNYFFFPSINNNLSFKICYENFVNLTFLTKFHTLLDWEGLTQICVGREDTVNITSRKLHHHFTSIWVMIDEHA